MAAVFDQMLRKFSSRRLNLKEKNLLQHMTDSQNTEKCPEKSKMHFIGPFVYVDKVITYITCYRLPKRMRTKEKKSLRTRGNFYPLIFPSKEQQFKYARYFFWILGNEEIDH